MSTTIIGIESSCDETSAAICQNGKVLNNIIATQTIHEQFGGVVPELASRAHQINIVPVVHQALQKAELALGDVSAVAYTRGPGLLGALLVGASFGKAMAMSLGIPLIGVNHMRAHVLAHFIDDPKPSFPFLCLTVSGGHTQIVQVNDYHDLVVIGQTIDDAVGEAFDKGAKLLGLPYPGGPQIDRLAVGGDPQRFTFAQSDVGDLNYSFSGIKTSLLYFLRKELSRNEQFIEKNIHDLSASYQWTLVEMLFKKLEKAAAETGIKQVALAGGVAANSAVRNRLLSNQSTKSWEVFIPEFQYCTDNAGMIAMTGYFDYSAQKFDSFADSPMPRMAI